MAELLLELFSEEIPARMQSRARDDLARLLGDGLKAAGLEFKSVRSFATPRRLTVVIDGLPARSPDVKEERKGPRVTAPDAAIQGFLKSAGLASLDQAEIREGKKGDYYFAVINKPGRPTQEVIAALVPDIVRNFAWPKSMRWGAPHKSRLVTEEGDTIVTESGDQIVVETWLWWVRPLHSILCLFAGKVVAFEIDGIKSGKETRGHRFMAPEPFSVKGFHAYVAKLHEARVILDTEERKAIILKLARGLAEKEGLTLVEDEALLAENAGLTEWPIPLMGAFDRSFLDLPPEVLATSLKAHQKCFSLRKMHASRRGLTPAPQHEEKRRARDPHPEEAHSAVSKDEAPAANRFIVVANLKAKDGGKAIAAGNERVIRARLADAQFFYEQDRSVSLEDRVPKLQEIVFHKKLGSQYDRVQRLRYLARELAPLVGADPDLAERAAIVSKSDLTTEMVGEFPELQGVIGRYYALDQEEDPAVADAIAAHYKPQGPSDEVPRDPVAIAVALADKLDMLVGFWAIDEKPTGSKDPYALRRAALGIIRIVLENGLRVPLEESLRDAWIKHVASKSGKTWGYQVVGESSEGKYLLEPLNDKPLGIRRASLARDETTDINDHIPVYFVDAQFGVDDDDAVYDVFGEMEFTPEEIEKLEFLLPVHGGFQHLPSFFADRLKVHLREHGARHDLVDAVFALGGDDLLMIVARVEALGRFLDSEDGANLLVGTKRAVNILRIEEKKDGVSYGQKPDPRLLEQPEEKALAKIMDEVEQAAAKAVAGEDFEAAMAEMARLRAPVDEFFDHVTVNTEDAKLRANRLRLLNRIRATTATVADFSKIEG